MAWNPSKEVAVARQAALGMGDAGHGTVDRCIVLFTTVAGHVGYSSYGHTKEACAEAKMLGDAMYDAAHAKYEHVLDNRAVFAGVDPERIDWAGLRAQVNQTMAYLEAIQNKLEAPPEWRDLIQRQLVLPVAQMLARACACVQVEEGTP